MAALAIDTTDALSVPLKLNQGHAPATGAKAAQAETLGTLPFTKPFEQCLERSLRSETAEDHLPQALWFQSPYVVSRLQKRIGGKLLQAVLAKRAALERLSASNDPQYDDWRIWRAAYDETIKKALVRFGLTRRQVERTEREIMKLVRTEFMVHHPWAKVAPVVTDDDVPWRLH